jgi:hypothetical protein
LLTHWCCSMVVLNKDALSAVLLCLLLLLLLLDAT